VSCPFAFPSVVTRYGRSSGVPRLGTMRPWSLPSWIWGRRVRPTSAQCLTGYVGPGSVPFTGTPRGSRIETSVDGPRQTTAAVSKAAGDLYRCGALAHECDRHRVGAYALARDLAGGVRGADAWCHGGFLRLDDCFGTAAASGSGDPGQSYPHSHSRPPRPARALDPAALRIQPLHRASLV
jgi:hypothetical protein